MKQNKHPKNIESFIQEQIKTLMSSMYFTLISIIQAGVIGYLFFVIDNNWYNISSTHIILIIITFLMVVTTWHEYMMGGMTFKFIPGLEDSLIPFLLGFSEFFVVRTIFSDLYQWYFALAIFCFVGWLAYFNMFHKSKVSQYTENAIILERLGSLPIVTEVWSFSMVMGFAFFGLITYQFASNLTIQYVTLSFSVIQWGAFLGRAILYWKRIVGDESSF